MDNEFDYYAKNYSYGLEQPIKRLLGKTAQDFFILKVKRLLSYLEKFPLTANEPSAAIRFLDFGCGTGLLIKTLEKYNLGWAMAGCDVSEKMLNQAKNILGEKYSSQLFLLDNDLNNLPKNYYHLIVANNVFHHIKPEKRNETLEKLHSALQTNGCLVIFEHNPLNPLVRWMVKKTGIDKNAILINPREIINGLKINNFNFLYLGYIMFFPPRFKSKTIDLIEEKMSFWPGGGQYLVVGQKMNLTAV